MQSLKKLHLRQPIFDKFGLKVKSPLTKTLRDVIRDGELKSTIEQRLKTKQDLANPIEKGKKTKLPLNCQTMTTLNERGEKELL